MLSDTPVLICPAAGILPPVTVKGRGTFWAEAGCHGFGPQSLLFFVPYQNVRLAPEEPIRGVILQFHAVAYGLMIAAHPWQPAVATVGSFLVFLMSFITLSFLVNTPECWVPPLGDARHGFPYLSGPGRLVLKDAIMMGAALVTMADSARASLRGHLTVSRRAARQEQEEALLHG